MFDFKLKPKLQSNSVTVFFEGKETPPELPVTTEPAITINTDEYFYFSVNFSNKEIIKGLKFHSSDAVAKDIGFPVLYNALHLFLHSELQKHKAALTARLQHLK